MEKGEKTIVGLNAFQIEDEDQIDTLFISDETAGVQIAFLEEVRARRDAGAVSRTLDALRKGASGEDNTMPLIIDCVKEYCSVGEISDALRDVYGTYEEPAII